MNIWRPERAFVYLGVKRNKSYDTKQKENLFQNNQRVKR